MCEQMTRGLYPDIGSTNVSYFFIDLYQFSNSYNSSSKLDIR